MKIKYAGPAKDYSGYGEANRHDIGALVSAGIDVSTQIPIYTPDNADFGRLGTLAASLENKDIGYQIKILHTTPNVYRQFYEAGKYHIGRAFWETDKAPLDFALNLQTMDEIWTGSEANKQAIINAGVTKPIYIIPEAIDDNLNIEEIEPYIVQNKPTYKFYSIFEWTERKNPLALLEAFWREFEGRNDVSLTIKTYLNTFSSDKRQGIDQQIRKLKARLNLKSYAPVFLYRHLMDRYQVYRFHQTFDCFVSAHRGEGWGIPQMEALLLGKPVISTNYCGIHEYLTHKRNAYLVKHTMCPISNMEYNSQWYTPDQNWADVDIDDLRQGMRWVFEHKDEAKEMGKKGRELVLKEFSLKAVGLKMKDRLTQIQQSLEPKL